MVSNLPAVRRSQRLVHVENAEGRIITSRTHPKFPGLKSTLGALGAPLVEGEPWDSEDVAARVREIAGALAKHWSVSGTCDCVAS